MSKTRIALAFSAALAFGGLVFGPIAASAAPMLDRGVSSAVEQSELAPQTVRTICNRYGACTWVPSRRHYREFYYGRPRFGRPHYGRPRFGRPFRGRPMRGPHFFR